MIKLERPICPNPIKLSIDYAFSENKEALKKSTYDKCMYCESKILHIDYGDVEHIKPKGKHPHLTFDWNNLGFSCTICNQKYKIECDDARLINPYEEDPADHLSALGSFILPKNGSSKGEFSYKKLGLNRLELSSKRNEALVELERLIENIRNQQDQNIRTSLIQVAKEYSMKHQEYSFVKKIFIDEMFLKYGIVLVN